MLSRSALSVEYSPVSDRKQCFKVPCVAAGPATSELDPSILEKMLVSLAGSAGVSAAASSLNIVNDAPYSFQLHFSFTSDSITATSAQEKVASAIGALPRDIGKRRRVRGQSHLV